MGPLTQEDPIGIAGGLNLYGYAAGDPINFSDPFGLCPNFWDPQCIAAAASNAIGSVVEAGNRIAYGLRDLAVGVALAFSPIDEVAAVGAIGKAAIPAVRNAKLGNIVSDLYKGAKGPNPIGVGSTADAIRYERLTGNAVGGTFHTEKGTQYLRALDNWLGKNPNASEYDRLVAQSLRDDLSDALGMGNR